MPMPSSDWHMWYPGEPNDEKGKEDCTVITNYMFWEVRTQTMDRYYWRDHGCSVNAQEISGYICESKSLFFIALFQISSET